MLQAEVAAVAQCCNDVAVKYVQMERPAEQQAIKESPKAATEVSRAKMAVQGRRRRHQLAALARAAADATSSTWQPQLGGLPLYSSGNPCTHSLSGSCQGEASEATVALAVRDSLCASAARAEANERFIQDLALAVEDVIEKHTREDEQAADAAVEGISRFLEFADVAHSRPNESSIKQLVRTSDSKNIIAACMSVLGPCNLWLSICLSFLESLEPCCVHRWSRRESVHQPFRQHRSCWLVKTLCL